MHNMTFEL